MDGLGAVPGLIRCDYPLDAIVPYRDLRARKANQVLSSRPSARIVESTQMLPHAR